MDENMKNLEEALIVSLLTKNEYFKGKWLQLSEDDLFEWIKLQDELNDLAVKLRSRAVEEKMRLDVDKGKRTLELKTESDENGKKKYTESQIDAMIRSEFIEQDLEINYFKTQQDLLSKKSETITEYVNIVKLTLKK